MLSRLLELWSQGSEHVEQGCELLLAAADPPLLAALWQSVSQLAAGLWPSERSVGVGWCPRDLDHRQDRILATLLAASPPALLAAQPIVQELRSLHLAATDPERTQAPIPWPALDKLAFFPRLRTLSLHGMVLPALPAVRALTLSSCALPGPTPLPEGLERLRLLQGEAVLPHLRATHPLELLEIGETHLEDAALLLPVEQLELDTAGGLPVLHAMPVLQRLTLQTELRSRTPSLHLPPLPDTVEEIRLYGWEKVALDALAHHPRLRILMMPSARASLTPLAAVPTLRLLRLSTASDLSPLVGLPHLRRLELKRLPSQTCPPELEPWLHLRDDDDDIPF